MGILFANHAKAVTVESLEADATTIACSLQQVGSFPDIAEQDDYFYLSLIPMGHTEAQEVVRVTGINKETGILNIERGLDNTAAVQHRAGTSAEIRIPAIALNDILSIANAGLSGQALQRFAFDTPTLEWEVNHNQSTTIFSERIRVRNESGNLVKEEAGLEIIDDNTFMVTFTEASSGYVDVRF